MISSVAFISFLSFLSFRLSLFADLNCLDTRPLCYGLQHLFSENGACITKTALSLCFAMKINSRTEQKKDPAAVKLGRRGGLNWWASLGKKERAERIAKMVKARAK